MFDQITVTLAALSGKLKGAATLRKYFWAFLAAIGFAVVILSYNAFMSLNYYRQMLERFTPWSGDGLAVFVTISIAVIAYFLISSITGTILDFVAGREEKTEGHLPMFVAVVIALVLILFLDVSANLKGVDYVSITSTKAAMENPIPGIIDRHDNRLKDAEARYEKELSENRAGIAAIKKYAGEAGHKCNQVGCEKGIHKGKTGAAHWAGAITPYGLAVIAKYQAVIDQVSEEKGRELAAIRGDKKADIDAATNDYQRDAGRYDSTIADKQTGHTNLVWFAYGLAFLLCVFTNHYADRALIHINGEPEPRLAGGLKGTQQTGAVGFATGSHTPSTADNIRMMAILDRLEALEITGIGEPVTTAENDEGQQLPISENTEIEKTVFVDRQPHINCLNCGELTPKKSHNKKFCSRKCGDEHYARQNPDKPVRFRKGGSHA